MILKRIKDLTCAVNDLGESINILTSIVNEAEIDINKAEAEPEVSYVPEALTAEELAMLTQVSEYKED